ERAASAGAAALVTSAPPPRPDLPVLTVDDPRRALWAFGAHARRRYTNPVVAVTGTAGKSTTTAMLQHVLAGTDRVHVPTGNWNTIDGVSFTLTGLLAPSDIAVLEMAHVGFVGFDDWSTPELARPDVAVVTTIGQAHAELDATVEGTARRKARIFRGVHGQGTAVLNLDAPRSDILMTDATAHASQVSTYARHAHATLRLVDYVPVTGQIRVQHGDQEVALRLGVRGEHNALNALAVLAVLHALGRAEQDYLERFAEIRPLKGRGQV